MQKKIPCLILFLIFTLAFISSCGSKEKKEAKREQEQEQKVKDLKTSLINRYNPIILPSNDLRGKLFTIDLQNFFIRQEQKPVLFEGILDDITKDGDHFTAHFTTHLNKYKSMEFQLLSKGRTKFHLKCNYEDISTIVERPLKPLNQEDDIQILLSSLLGKPEYFVVCSVKQVKKIVYYAISAYPISSEEAEIEIEFPDSFSVSGKLITMVKYPDLQKH